MTSYQCTIFIFILLLQGQAGVAWKLYKAIWVGGGGGGGVEGGGAVYAL